MSDASDRLHNIMTRRRDTLPPAGNIEPAPQQEVEKRVSNAIVRYCDSAADEIEKEIARAQERVAKFVAERKQTAANLRQLGQLECDHILAMSATVNSLVEAARSGTASLNGYMEVKPPVRRPDVIEAVAKELNGGTELPT